MAKKKVEMIEIEKIELAHVSQSRVAMDEECVETYAEAWREGAEFPPVDLFTMDGDMYWIGDGWHRVEGAMEAPQEHVPAIVHAGDERDAILFACSANKAHGLRRTNADKRKAVDLVLVHEPKWSNRKIAEHCHVSDMLVADVRKGASSCNAPEKHRKTKDGRSYPATRKTPPPSLTAEPVMADDDFLPEAIEAADTGPDIDELAAPYRQAVNDLNRMTRDFAAASEDQKTGVHLVDKIVRIQKSIGDLKGAIRMAEPVAVCPDCHGDGCKTCGNAGFLTRMIEESREEA